MFIIYYDYCDYEYEYHFWDGKCQHIRFIWKRKVLSLLNCKVRLRSHDTVPQSGVFSA